MCHQIEWMCKSLSLVNICFVCFRSRCLQLNEKNLMINLVTLFCYALVFRRKKNLQSPKSDYQSALQELHAQLNLESNFLCIFFYSFFYVAQMPRYSCVFRIKRSIHKKISDFVFKNSSCCLWRQKLAKPLAILLTSNFMGKA